jgi:hypothetical protein
MISLVLFLMLSQSQRPLPNLDQFLEATRAELIVQLNEDELLKGYVYRRKTSREKLDGDGMSRDSEVAEHDIFQFDTGAYEKLISKDGVRVPQQELHKQDDEQLVKGWKTDDSRPPFPARSPEAREAMIDDMFRVWDFQMVRREWVAGRPAVLIAFAPKEDVKPRTPAGKWIKNASGVAWVDEADHRIVRMRTVLFKDAPIAWWPLAKVHKGTEIIREWRKINNEVWLPSRSLKRLRGRDFVVGFNFLQIEEYSDYRKFDAETKLQFVSPN